MNNAFWRTKTLEQMSNEEWESLCDGCGLCCLNKIEDWDTGEIHWTNLACSLLDCETCRCSDYENRFAHVPDCIDLDPGKVAELFWLPSTCAYRLVAEGKDLYDWHHLKSGSRKTVHASGVSAVGRAVPDKGLPLEEYVKHIVDWPGRE